MSPLNKCKSFGKEELCLKPNVLHGEHLGNIGICVYGTSESSLAGFRWDVFGSWLLGLTVLL
jgi:hypothetical protein